MCGASRRMTARWRQTAEGSIKSPIIENLFFSTPTFSCLRARRDNRRDSFCITVITESDFEFPIIRRSAADPESLKGWREDNASAPLSFIANAHNELCAFYVGKSDLLKKILRPIGGGHPHSSPLKSAFVGSYI